MLIFAAPAALANHATGHTGGFVLPQDVRDQATREAAQSTAAGGTDCGGNSIAGICFPETELPGSNGNITIEGILKNFMNWLFSIFAFLAIISFIIAGIQYFMAAGNPESAKKAKQNMVYSIIGVVVALSSLVIIYAVEGFLNSTTTF
jgi:hypothetical protein